jgi:uncharacterized protein (TIGR03067 family)
MKFSLMLITLLSTLFAAAVAGSPAGDGKKAAKATPKKNAKPAAAKNDLIGLWYGLRAEYDGTQPMNPDLVRSTYGIIEADRISVIFEGKPYGPIFYRVNQAVKPYQVDIWGTTPEGVVQKARGIYRIQDDKLWFCLAMEKDPRPTSFTTTSGSKAGLVIGRRGSR